MKALLTALLVVVLLLLNGCYYDEVTLSEGLPKNVSLKNDVVPIFNSNCNTTGCHDAESSHSPSLVQANAYNALTTGKYVNTYEPEKSKLYLEISSGSMPPSGPLTLNQQKVILAWITEGAKNN
jgi:hypothetical protein